MILTLVWLLLGVYDLMSTEGGRLTEGLPTHFAHEWPGTGVDRHVASEVVMGTEHLPAYLAVELPVLARSRHCHCGVKGGLDRAGGAGVGLSGSSLRQLQCQRVETPGTGPATRRTGDGGGWGRR